MKKVTVRAFGARLHRDMEPIATDVFQRQNHYWNKLVEIERAAREQYRAAVEQADPELLALTEISKAETAVLEALKEGRAKDRAAQKRKKTDKAESFSALIKASSTRLKELREKMKGCKERAKLAAKPKTEAIELERRAAVKAANAASGLWWAHSETVLTKYDVARVKAMKQGAELRFNRFDGEGSMGIRLPGSGAYTIADIEAGRTSMVSIREATPAELGRMSASKRGGDTKRVIVTLRAGESVDGSYKVLSFLTTMHRDCPLDAPIKVVTARRDMHVNKPEWKLVFTFVEQEEAAPPLRDLPEKAVGVDLGWRQTETGLRVATIYDGERCEFIELPKEWLARMERADTLRGQLDDFTNAFAKDLLPVLKAFDFEELDEKDRFRVLAGKAMRAKGNYAQLLISLCDAHKDGKPLGEDFDADMQSWSRAALKLAIEAFNTKRKAIDNRKHLYRNVAARLVKKAGLIAVEDIGLADMAKLEDSELHATSRSNRVLASIYELKLSIENAAKREGREYIKVPAQHTTMQCYACGHIQSAKITELIYECEGCGIFADQDENAAKNMRKIGMEMGNCLV